MTDLIDFYQKHQRLPWPKRLFDIGFASVGLVVSLPLVLLGGITVLVSDGRPIVFQATRVGAGGKPLVIPKLRTMRTSDTAGPAIASGNDDRVFPGGEALRRLKLDELLQLKSVLLGHMSVVGPRPEDPDIVEKYYDEEQRRSLEAPPGLTSPGTLAYMNNMERELDASAPEADYVIRALPAKIALDLEYLASWKFTIDLRIISRTATAILSRR